MAIIHGKHGIQRVAAIQPIQATSISSDEPRDFKRQIVITFKCRSTSPEAKEMADFCKEHKFHFSTDGSFWKEGWSVYFDNEEDATMFQLRWQ